MLSTVAAVLTALLSAQQPPPAHTIKIDVTIVGAATTTPIAEPALPRRAELFTRLDLQALGLTSAVDALRLLPGVDVRARGPMDVQADFSLRGSTFGQNLVLVDGIRINDSQSGHHNGELPIPVSAIDHVEVVNGASSSAHGADALGGVINIVTRRDAHAELAGVAGENRLFGFSGSAKATNALAPTVSGWYSRTDGFMFDRDFGVGGGLVRGAIRNRLVYDLRHSRRAFGANGFYGASPSKEWTDQTLASATLIGAPARGWSWDVTGAYKNHGDHFRWDINRPGFAENQHRTNSGDVTAKAARLLRNASVVIGASGGADVVRSSNLGDHSYNRAGAFLEVTTPDLPRRATYQLGLRADRYSTFGSNVSPTAAAAFDLGRGWRVRASGGRAFRVPTFTELYYHDPANQGSADLDAEHGWTLDAGLDYARDSWTLSATPFGRWDDNVIDWVRPTAADLWRSTNVRDVTTRGIEIAASRRFDGGLARVAYTKLDVDAPSLGLLSKYVLEYARDSFAASAAVPVARTGVTLSANADMRRRLDGQKYALLGARVAHSSRHATIFVDGSNLLDREYHEVLGVAMPGRWISAGIILR
jgi:iron complex outermembrane receptor protein